MCSFDTSYETETNGFCVILRSAARFSFTRTLRHRFADFVARRSANFVRSGAPYGPSVPLTSFALRSGFRPASRRLRGLRHSPTRLCTCLLVPNGTANTAYVMERTSKTAILSTSLPISKKNSCHQLLDKYLDSNGQVLVREDDEKVSICIVHEVYHSISKIWNLD